MTSKIVSIILASSALLLPGCIEETFPEDDYATAEQVGASASALEASLKGIPPQTTQGYYVYGDQVHETDMSYPALMIAMTEMMGDMYPCGENSGYDWYRNYNTFNAAYGDNSYMAYLPWYTLYRFVKAANDIISVVDVEDETLSNSVKGMAGVAYAYRAFSYYTLMLLFEPVENIYTDCSNVLGLTVPIVTEETTGEDSKSNPRATHDEMVEFILNDLRIAEECLQHYTPESKYYPSLAVVYGLMARTYLWDEDFANAATYARKAIETSGCTPLNQAELVDLTTGFNTVNHAWLWGGTYSPENMGNLCNWTGWMSGEADWGYSSLTFPSIDRSLYDRMADNDYRKPQFLDPEKYDFYNYETARDRAFIEGSVPYLALKFRCRAGNWESYEVGGACDVPFMRVEEMYLIEAEAIGASQGVSAGVNALNSFMNNYRQPGYNCTASDLRSFQLEVMWQARLEGWGEGWGFQFAKRLKPDVIQNYEGTNAPENIFKINCKGIKPSWNLVITQFETQSNPVLQATNNPNPTATVTGPTPIGEFAPANF